MRWKILDRYMISELVGPFSFGLLAFSLIFIATQLLALSRLVSDAHAPFWAVLEYFIWGLPQVLIYVIPMSMLLGVLLALQRLSGESEITALKAGGVGLVRIVAPFLAVGFVLSLVSLFLGEELVPLANDRAQYLHDTAIAHIGPVADNLSFTTNVQGGGRQLTAARGFESSTQTLLDVTVIQFDARGKASEIIFSERAQFQEPSWTFFNANSYHFNPDGTTFSSSDPILHVDLGQRPTNLMRRAAGDNPENMSRQQIAQIIGAGQLNGAQVRQYTATYQAKLARPFACFVFALIAVPFGLRSARGGGMGLGFGLALAIVFVYFVIASICLSLGDAGTGFAAGAAWLPNLLFTAIGVTLLRRAAAH